MHTHACLHTRACVHTCAHTHTFTWARTARFTQVKDTHEASHPFLPQVQLPTRSRGGVTQEGFGNYRNCINTWSWQTTRFGFLERNVQVHICTRSVWPPLSRRKGEPLKQVFVFNRFLKILFLMIFIFSIIVGLRCSINFLLYSTGNCI